MSANDRTGVGGGSGEYRTPQPLFEVLNRRWLFDFDMWASHENNLTVDYATAEGVWMGEPASYQHHRRRSAARRNGMITGTSGLDADLVGLRCFGNPPYTRGLIDKCIQSVVDRRDQFACMAQLVPAATETAWFQLMYDTFGEPMWLPRRVHFIDPTTNLPAKNPPSGMCIFEANVPRKVWLGALHD